MTSRPAARDQAELSCRLTEEAFCRWVGQAEPGDVVEYHRGQLSVDRTREASTLGDMARRELGKVADRALQLAAEDRLILVQRRLGEGAFSYLAIKAAGRSRPASAGVRHALYRAEAAGRAWFLARADAPTLRPNRLGNSVGRYPTVLQPAR